MIAGKALIATLVVAGKARHKLLCARSASGLDLGQEVECADTAERGGQASVMKHLNFATLSLAICETEVRGLRFAHRYAAHSS